MNMPFFMHVAVLYSPVAIIPLYVLLMRKIKILSLRKPLLLYILALWLIYFPSLYWVQLYLIPQLNEARFGLPGHIASMRGRSEDIVIQLIVLTPLYIGVNKLFSTSFRSKKWHVVYFFIYFSINYAMWRLSFCLLSGPIDYGGF